MTRFEPSTSEGYMVNLAARAFARALARRTTPLGGVPSEFPILLALREHDGLSQRDLVERAGIEQGSMAQLLQRMERDDLVVRQRDPDDRRRVQYSLTAKSRRLAEAMVAQAVEVNAVATRGLTAAERRELRRLLAHTTANLAKDADDAP